MERPDASRRRVLALSFRSGGMVLFIHWRGGAERGAGTHHGRADGHGAGRFLFAKFYLRNWPRRDWQVSWSSSATTYGVDFANRRSQQPGEGQHINQTLRRTLARTRGAPTQRRRSAERPAIRPTRWRRLLAAVADSKSRNSFSWKDDADVAAAAGGRTAPWTAMSMRDRPAAGCATCASRLCGAGCGNGRSPRGGRRRWFVGGNRAMLAAPRISAARRRRRATAQQRATNTTLAATRRHR